MSKVLTIAVAVYNVEKYLESCLASFSDERLKNDLEVLIIYDGSKDNSKSIAEKYVEMYPSIFKLINKINGGYGTTFHLGFENATGKYYKVVDGDDYVDTDALCHLIEKLKHCDSDMVLTHHADFDDRRGTVPVQKKSYDSLIEGHEYLFSDIADQFTLWFIVNIVYKTSILQDNTIPIGDKYYVDLEYDIYPMFYVKTITCFDLTVTQYRTNQSGNSTTLSNVANNAEQFVTVGERVLQYYDSHKVEDKNTLHYIECTIAEIICNSYFSLLIRPVRKSNYKILKQIDENVRKRYPNIYMCFSKNYRIISKFLFLYPLISVAVRVFVTKTFFD